MRARGSINGKKELLGENLLYDMNSEPNCNSSKVENNEENLENSKVTESDPKAKKFNGMEILSLFPLGREQTTG